MGRLLSGLACIWLSISIATASWAAEKVALVIGNADYSKSARLITPYRDVEKVDKVLSGMGFEVERLVDQDHAGLVAALKRFRERSAQSALAIIYFAGHGIEINRENYLIPVDATLADAKDAELEAISISLVEASIASAPGLKLIVIDACRNNPFKEQMRGLGQATRAGQTRGLAPIEPSSDIIVAYSAKHGSVALDGDGESGMSPYAEAFTRRIATPGKHVVFVLGAIRDDVEKGTDGQQVPHVYGSFSEDTPYLIPPVDGTGPDPELQSALTEAKQRQAEVEAQLATERQAAARATAEAAEARARELAAQLAAAASAAEAAQAKADAAAAKASVPKPVAAVAPSVPPSVQYCNVVNVVWNDVLNIRNRPHSSGTLIGTIPPDGDGVLRSPDECQRGWCPVCYGSTCGWVNARYLDCSSQQGVVVGSQEEEGDTGQQSCSVVGVAWNDVLNVRSAPSAKAAIVTMVPPGSQNVVRRSDRVAKDWFEVCFEGGCGWASSRYLSCE